MCVNYCIYENEGQVRGKNNTKSERKKKRRNANQDKWQVHSVKSEMEKDAVARLMDPLLAFTFIGSFSRMGLELQQLHTTRERES